MFRQHGIWFPNGDGDQFKYFTDDANGVWTYQQHKIDAALNYCKKFDVAVDVGAHIGFWSRQLAKKFQHVIAFEPVSDFCECFRKNVISPNVLLENTALGDVLSDCTLHVKTSDTLVTHIVEDDRHCDYSFPSDAYYRKSKLTTLDYYSLPELDFLKIDTEGYEYQVILGGMQTIKRCKPTIIVEQKGHEMRYGLEKKAAVNLLVKLGARGVWSRAGDYVMSW